MVGAQRAEATSDMRRNLMRLAGLALLLSAALTISAFGAPTLNEYPLTTKDRGPEGVALGPDGNVWFAESLSAGAIGTITPSGEITEYTTGLTSSSQPEGIAAGGDGNLWFTEFANPGRIGKITPSGTITEYPTTSTNSQPDGIAAGPDGNLWFTEFANPGRIGKITPSGTVTEYPTTTTNSQPTGIAAGPDGNLWFTEAGGNGAIGRITPSGTITEYTKGLTPKAQPSGIAAGPDGALWFTESAGSGRIGRITVGGSISEYSSGLTASSEPLGIAAGNDGAMYFTEAKNPGRIGRITMSGAITERATTTTNSQPQQIVTGGDGNLWFSELGAHGQMGTLTVAPEVAGGSYSSTERTAVLKGLVSAASQSTTYTFEYGPTAAYGSHTPATSGGSGATLSPVSASVEGLEAGSTYHFRLVATNASGTTYGEDQTMTTTQAPGAETLPAAAVTTTGATLKAQVRPHGQPTTYVFEWGTTTSYGHEAPIGGGEAGSDEATHHMTATLEGLSPDTHYHYRVVASNCGGCEEGTVAGADQTFTTAPMPTVLTEAASGVTKTEAVLHGSVEAHEVATSYRFEYGETTAYGSQTPAGSLPAGNGATTVSAPLSGLQPGHVYHFRLVASNCEGCVAGTTRGGDMVLVTEALPSALSETPAPSPAPIAAPLAPAGPAAPSAQPPAIGQTALLKVASGTVTVRSPGGAALTLSSPADIPVGSTVDTTRGRLELSTAIDTRGDTQTAAVWGGVFTLGQGASGMTTMTVPHIAGCRRHSARGAAVAAARRPSAPTLWAHDNHGRFSTRGHNSVATVRGTWWGTTERCDGTLTTVHQGLVSVRPRHGRAVLVRAGHSYLAHA